MTNTQIAYLLPLLVLLNGLVSPNGLSTYAIGNTTITWLISFVLLIAVFWYKNRFFRPTNKSDYLIVLIYFIWMIIGALRGMFVAQGYWEWKQWVNGVLSLSLPVFVYVFSIPWILRNVLRLWLRVAVPLFFLFYIWAVSRLGYQFYLGPVLLLGCFLPLIEKKWRIVIILLLLIMIFADFGARSQVLKSLIAIVVACACSFSYAISTNVLRLAHWFFYILPVILLGLGMGGSFNVFQDLNSNEGKYKQTRIIDGNLIEEDLSADTRTLLYEEVIGSALTHEYWLFGRTPARGNDSYIFGSYLAEDLKTGKYERYKNEFCFPNVFTWLGFVGMLLYCLIYLKASYLAVYKSRNRFVKLIGVLIAFHFLYGWVEDINNFDILNITLWMLISIGFSEDFRKMNDRQFRYWIYRTVKF